ncbi:unnamed protein product [Lathyrus oleraceus]|jgi:hypothetical protein
MERGI